MNLIKRAITLLLLATGGCSQRVEETAEYKAACEGPPLYSVEKREQAMVDGYQINRMYDCIDKASYAAIAEQKAQWEATHTPEAIAKQQAEFAQQKALDDERRARETDTKPELVPVVLHPVDVNTATEASLAGVISIGPQTAAQIVAERNKRRFADWPDVANRVVALSAAQTALFASICGLTVNGKSLEGAPPDGAMAAMIQKKYSAYH